MPRAVLPTSTATTQQTPLFTGTSGWAYPTWKPGFYPAGTPARLFLQAYAERLNSVEVNYTFTKLPTGAQMQGWLDAVPVGFRFSFKAPQRITHFKRLRDCEDLVAEFLASLEPARHATKLGAVLFQLPPNFKADPQRLGEFLALPAFKPSGLKLAFEFRHESWFAEETYALLRKHHVALCVAESDGLVTPDVATADFRFYRLRKDGGYTSAILKTRAKTFASKASGDVYTYFKHEDEPTGALNAVEWRALLAKMPGEKA